MLTAFIAIVGSSIIMPFYLQNVRDFTPGMAGLLLVDLLVWQCLGAPHRS